MSASTSRERMPLLRRVLEYIPAVSAYPNEPVAGFKRAAQARSERVPPSGSQLRVLKSDARDIGWDPAGHDCFAVDSTSPVTWLVRRSCFESYKGRREKTFRRLRRLLPGRLDPEIPTHLETIRRVTAQFAVEIGRIRNPDSTDLSQVEPRVATQQRVKGPTNHLQPMSRRALVRLQWRTI
jgi:hypothetical protein